MNEVLANLYAVTKNPDHLRLAQAFNHEAIFAPLARGEDRLDGMHANTQIPKIIGAAREYELTGDARFHDVARVLLAAGGPEALVRDRRPQRRRAFLSDRMRFAEHLSPATCRDLQHVQHAQADAAHLRLAAHGRGDGLLRAGPVQPDPRLAGADAGDDDLLRPAESRAISRPTARRKTRSGAAPARAWKTTRSTATRSISTTRTRSTSISSSPRNFAWPEKGLLAAAGNAVPRKGHSSLEAEVAKAASPGDQDPLPGVDAARHRDRRQRGAGRHGATPGSYISLQREWRDGDTLDVRLPMSLRQRVSSRRSEPRGYSVRPDRPGGGAGRRGPGEGLALCPRSTRSGPRADAPGAGMLVGTRRICLRTSSRSPARR